jgi:hypothetical protein
MSLLQRFTPSVREGDQIPLACLLPPEASRSNPREALLADVLSGINSLWVEAA